MSRTGKLDVEVEVKSAPEKFWLSVKDSATIFPKAFPDHYKSIQVLEGDGKSVGSVRLITYGEGSPLVSWSKEKIEVVEEAERKVGYSVIDGGLLKYYKSFNAHLEVIPKKGDGSLVKWFCEFEKTSEEIPDPNIIRDFAVHNLLDLDAYIRAA